MLNTAPRDFRTIILAKVHYRATQIEVVKEQIPLLDDSNFKQDKYREGNSVVIFQKKKKKKRLSLSTPVKIKLLQNAYFSKGEKNGLLYVMVKYKPNKIWRTSDKWFLC